MLSWIVGFSILGSLGAVAGTALLLLFPDGMRRSLVPGLVSYATGTLLGAAFLGMIPAGLKQAPASPLMATVLADMVCSSCWKNWCCGVTATTARANCMAAPVR